MPRICSGRCGDLFRKSGCGHFPEEGKDSASAEAGIFHCQIIGHQRAKLVAGYARQMQAFALASRLTPPSNIGHQRAKLVAGYARQRQAFALASRLTPSLNIGHQRAKLVAGLNADGREKCKEWFRQSAISRHKAARWLHLLIASNHLR